MSLRHIFCMHLYTFKIYVQGPPRGGGSYGPRFYYFYCGKTQGIAKENNHFTVSPYGLMRHSVFVLWYPPSHKNWILMTFISVFVLWFPPSHKNWNVMTSN